MPKLILLFIVGAMAVVPVFFATRKSARKALREVQLVFVAAVCVWAYMCINWYPQLVPLDGKIGTWHSPIRPKLSAPSPPPRR